MKEKFEPFKELLKALREIRYAIGGKNSGTGEGNGNGNDIVLPKYICGYIPDQTSQTEVERLLEIDYDGRIYDLQVKLEYGEFDPSQFTEEEETNLIEFVSNHVVIGSIGAINIDNSLYVYTKEQKDTINKNSIIMEIYGIVLKLNDLVFVDLYDFLTANGGTTTLNIEKGQYYIIMHPLMYNSLINAPDIGDLTPIGDDNMA